MSAGEFSDSLVKEVGEATNSTEEFEKDNKQDEAVDLAMDCQSQVAAAGGAMSDPSGDSQMLNQLMQRMKSDLMYELRNLQHGERPVTGQGHRDNLRQFMLKHRKAGNREGNSPANVDAVEHHRPESVVVEVQGVVERRPVSSILQSVAFRRQLENAIRGGVSSASRRNQVNTRPSPRHQATRQGRRSPDTAGIPQASQVINTSPLPAASNEERPTLRRSDSADSIDSFSSAVSEQDLAELEDEEIAQDVGATAQDTYNTADIDEMPNPPQALPRSVFRTARSENPQPNGQAQESLQRARTGLATENNNDGDRHSPWMDISRIHREEFVQEISELLHSHLVSSALNSEFRATLELHTQDRVQASGTDGRAVRNFVRSLPGGGVIRNDFSHLGISTNDNGELGAFGFQNVSDDDHSNIDEDVDNISVRSMSVPYTQTNTYLGREIQSLKSQVASMKSMLKLTFDMQQEIQRCIRQEVAAAINAAAIPNPAPSRPVSDSHCLICLDEPSDTVLYRCGHMCVCYKCGRDLMSRGHNCPICRAPIHDVIRAYKTNAD